MSFEDNNPSNYNKPEKKPLDPVLVEKVCNILKKLGYENHVPKNSQEAHDLVLILRKRLMGETLQKVADDLGYSSPERVRQQQHVALRLLANRAEEEISELEITQIRNYLYFKNRFAK